MSRARVEVLALAWLWVKERGGMDAWVRFERERRAPAVPLASKENSLVWRSALVVSVGC